MSWYTKGLLAEEVELGNNFKEFHRNFTQNCNSKDIFEVVLLDNAF